MLASFTLLAPESAAQGGFPTTPAARPALPAPRRPRDPAEELAQIEAPPPPLASAQAEQGDAEAREVARPSDRIGTSDLGPGTLDRLLVVPPDAPYTFYGWVQNSFTGNTTGTPRDRDNFSVFPNRRANGWQGNQYYLVFEKPVTDEDRFDLGFRFDGFMGHDWEFSKSYGLFDRAFEPGQFTGIDLPQLYGQVHLPILTDGGVDIKGGRFYSPAGYESVMAMQRPLLSVANAFNFTPFTFFGVMSTIHASDRLDLYLGTVNGWDRWINQNDRWNYLVGFDWEFDEGGKTTLHTVLFTGPNQLPRFAPADSPFLPTGVVTSPELEGRVNPSYADHYRTYMSNVLTRKWSDKLTQASDVFFVVEPNVPGLGRGGRPRDSAWYGFANWFLYEFDPKLTGVWRAEIFRDEAGAAIGVADAFYEMTLGLIVKPKPWLWIRPEARYDWAQFKEPYHDGTRGSLFTLAFDVIVLY
jgi:hypothetical protein